MESIQANLQQPQIDDDRLSPRALNIEVRLRVLRDVFNLFAERYPRLAFGSVTQIPKPGHIQGDVNIYELKTKLPPELIRAIDGDLVPPGTTTELRLAVLKRDLCDNAVFATIATAEKLFEDTDVTVEWLVVRPRPHLLLEMDIDMRHLDVPDHSVLLVTDGFEGTQYIADFTIEQFGHPASAWFSTRDYYTRHFTAFTSGASQQWLMDQRGKEIVEKRTKAGRGAFWFAVKAYLQEELFAEWKWDERQCGVRLKRDEV